MLDVIDNIYNMYDITIVIFIVTPMTVDGIQMLDDS